MFNNIPKSKAILYIALIGLIPIFFVVANIISQKNAVETLQRNLEYVQNLALDKKNKQASNISRHRLLQKSGSFLYR